MFLLQGREHGQGVVGAAVVDKQPVNFRMPGNKFIKCRNGEPFGFVITGDDDCCSCHQISHLAGKYFAHLAVTRNKNKAGAEATASIPWEQGHETGVLALFVSRGKTILGYTIERSGHDR